MLLKQFYFEGLGHAFCVLASEKTGEAHALDIRRDVDQSYESARETGLNIRPAADTYQQIGHLTSGYVPEAHPDPPARPASGMTG